MTDQALAYIRDHRARFIDEWKQLCSIPSISTDPKREGDIARAAEWLRAKLDASGAAQSRIVQTDRHPVVWAEFPGPQGAPTLLVYGHYDVQPVDPIELWDHDPFDPVERDGRLYARGASDMKAQVMATVFALETLAAQGPMPLTIRCMFEGEEEIGSPSLANAIEKNRKLFEADVCLNLDTGMINESTPSIRYGLRGLAYFQLNVRGPARDLHSGSFGGVIHNPAQALAELIAGMHDAQGRVTLPGFYDHVRTLDDTERARLARVPITDEDVLGLSGASRLWGEPDFTVVERTGARPTLEINGIWGGFTGTGSKTVIGAEAHAKISMRLVPDQRSDEIRRQLEAYLRANAPSTVTWDLEQYAGGDPFICDPDSPAHAAFAAALEDVWQTEPILARIGGSVPVATEVERILGMPSILSGFALPGDQIHSPNESQHIETWLRGIEAITRFLYRYAGA